MLKGDVYFGALITPGVLVADLFFFSLVVVQYFRSQWRKVENSG